MSTSISAASISANTRARRACRRAASSGSTSTTVMVLLKGVVGVVGHGLPAAVRDEQHLFGTVPCGTVLPDEWLQHQYHSLRQDQGGVECLTDVAPDVGHFGAVDPQSVAE